MPESTPLRSGDSRPFVSPTRAVGLLVRLACFCHPAAAIDRLVHHSVILEMTGNSFRTETAKQAQANSAKSDNTNPSTTTTNNQ